MTCARRLVWLLLIAGCAAPMGPAQRQAAGLGPADLTLRAPVPAAVTTDIDADGDLDLVTTDGALTLHIWVNDGAGHYTRQLPRHASGWGADAPGPNIDDWPLSAGASTQNDPPSLRLDRGPDVDAAPLTALVASRNERVRRPSTCATRSPRAPPSAALLS